MFRLQVFTPLIKEAWHAFRLCAMPLLLAIILVRANAYLQALTMLRLSGTVTLLSCQDEWRTAVVWLMHNQNFWLKCSVTSRALVTLDRFKASFHNAIFWHSIPEKHDSIINREQYEKHLYNQSSHFKNYRGFASQRACLNLKIRCNIMLRFQLFWTCFVIFQAKNSVRNASTSNAATNSRTEAMLNVPPIVTYTVLEKAMGHKGKIWLGTGWSDVEQCSPSHHRCCLKTANQNFF